MCVCAMYDAPDETAAAAPCTSRPVQSCSAVRWGKNRRRGEEERQETQDKSRSQNQLLKQVGLNEAAIGRNGGWAAGWRCWQTEHRGHLRKPGALSSLAALASRARLARLTPRRESLALPWRHALTFGLGLASPR